MGLPRQSHQSHQIDQPLQNKFKCGKPPPLQLLQYFAGRQLVLPVSENGEALAVEGLESKVVEAAWGKKKVAACLCITKSN